MRAAPTASVATLLLALATNAPAQTVHLVGPSGFAQISHAIAAAAPGDTIHVAAGTYLPFTLDKPLTILGLPPGRIEVLAQGGASRLRPPVGTTATLARIEFRSPWANWFSHETRIERGTVFCEDCLFEAPGLYGAGGVTVENATAVLRGCVAVGNGYSTGAVGSYNAGLVATNAQVFATDCWLRGSDSAFDSYGSSAEGLRAGASTVHLVRCIVEGGTTRGCLGSGPSNGIRLTGSSRAWLADCTVRGGPFQCTGGTGGPGLLNSTSNPVELARTTITGGTGGGGTGTALIGPSTASPLLGLDAAVPPLTRGSAWTVAYRTQPGWPVLVALGLELAPRLEPAVAQPVLLATANLSLVALLVGDPNGAAPFTTSIPANPAFVGTRLFVQAVSGLGAPLQTAPPIGGLVR